MSWFEGCLTVATVKQTYRRLALKHHPDMGGDHETMVEINEQYHAKLASLSGEETVGTDGKSHTYWYKRDVEQEIMDKIAEILTLRMKDVRVELIGTWVWLSGDTKPHKEDLKEIGCRWHGKRQMWYWHRPTRWHREYSGVDMDVIRWTYGARDFEQDENSRAVVARA